MSWYNSNPLVFLGSTNIVRATYIQKEDLLKQGEEDNLEGKRRTERGMRILGGMKIYCCRK